jgi:hypothetical protein
VKICKIYQILADKEGNKNERVGECRAHVRNEKRVQVKWGIVKGNRTVTDLNVEGRMLLNVMLENQDKGS